MNPVGFTHFLVLMWGFLNDEHRKSEIKLFTEQDCVNFAQNQHR